MHKPFEVMLTPAEQQALRDSLINTYEQCRCMPGKECQGHAFLSERDRHVGRIDRMLWIRRTLAAWLAAEYTGKCKACGRDAEHTPGAERCMQCTAAANLLSKTVPATPTVPHAPGPKLPW